MEKLFYATIKLWNPLKSQLKLLGNSLWFFNVKQIVNMKKKQYVNIDNRENKGFELWFLIIKKHCT